MDSAAAELQKRHAELEGQPDPFPSLNDTPVKAQTQALVARPDPDSVEAFPSLSSTTGPANQPAATGWGAPRIKATISKQPTFSDSFTCPIPDLSTAGRDGKPTTLGEIMKQVMSQYRVKIEASTNQKLRQTTIFIRAEREKDLDKAKWQLQAALSPTVVLTLDAPVSTIPLIIGSKGANLKLIRDKTGVRIDIPRRDNVTGNGQANGGSHDPSRTGTPLPDNEEEEEATVPITITGPQPSAIEAQSMIRETIASRPAWSTRRVGDIPPYILPFVIRHRAKFLEAAAGVDVTLVLKQDIGEITVSGDRSAVIRVIDSIKSAVNFYTAEVTSVKMTLPKRQHRLLMGSGADEVMAKSNCAVIVQKLEEPGDDIIVWGRGQDLPNGLSAVMAKANSAYIHEFPLPGPIAVSRQLLNYMIRIGYPETVTQANPGASVYTPPQAVIDKANVLNVDILGDKPAVDAAVRQVSELIGKLIGATKDVHIDRPVHPILNAPKNAKKIESFHDEKNVSVYFPLESSEQSLVLLVYDPFSPNASPSPVEKAQRLEEVEKELLKMAKASADVKSERIAVEKKWHTVVAAELDRIAGEDRTLSIKIGADAGDSTTEDIILVHGIRTEVDQAVQEITKIVEDAKEDEVLSSYVTEFEIDRDYVGRIVGSQGANVNKLRDSLKVKIDFQDDYEEKKEEVTKKSKKSTTQKAKVKITGRKENADEAKKRIIALAEKYADETQEILKIPHRYHASLIGQNGKYVIRLEDRHGVKVVFPRDKDRDDGRASEQSKDEVLIKGGRKGVASAKAELLDALEFEKENDNVAEFTIPARAVARVLGKAGASINEIKDNTGAQIDIDKSGDGGVAHVTVRGQKSAIADAKAAILAIAEQVHEEISDSITIEPQFHRTLIGVGGQGLKDLITRVGGPTDPKSQAGLIRFPRQGEPSDQVQIRGEPKLVEKIKAELEEAVAALRDRVVLGVAIPAAQHRALIGRGGQHLNDLQSRTGAQIQFPGSRSYNGVGEPYNMDELADADAADIVKVSGSRSACEKAIEELKASVKPPAPEGVTGTLTVPLKYHHAVTQQGNLFRNLRSFGVQVEQSALPQQPPVPPHPTASGDASEARIDDPEDSAATAEYEWQVVPNYQNAEEGDSEWTFKARDQAALENAISTVEDAIEHAKSMTHVGFLTLPDRSMFPRIVGSKGANVARLRAESNADITVSREDSTIVIIGSESAIQNAKDAILRMTTQGGQGGGRGRGRRDY